MKFAIYEVGRYGTPTLELFNEDGHAYISDCKASLEDIVIRLNDKKVVCAVDVYNGPVAIFTV